MHIKSLRNLSCSSAFLKNRKSQKAMSLIEIIMVIALIGTIMTIVLQSLGKRSEDAKIDTAKIAMKTLGMNLENYKLHNFSYPTTEQGLDALLSAPGDATKWRGPYVETEDVLNDPWGKRYEYEMTGGKYKIISGGSDLTVGTEDDITHPEVKAPQEKQE